MRWKSLGIRLALALLLFRVSAVAEQKPLFDSTALSGEWGGIRSPGSGITIELGYTQEYLGVVSGGIRRTGEYDALASLDLEFDLEKLAGWTGASLHATGFSIVGSSLSAEAIGDDSNVSNINARNSVRLFELFLEQNLFAGRASIRAGQLAVDSEFFGSEIGDIPGGGLFINSDFGVPPIASFNAPLPIYYIAAPGLRFRVKPTESTSIQIGVYDGNPAPDALGEPGPGFIAGRQLNDHGTDFHLAASEGALFIGEASVVGKNGSYKLGGYLHSAEFTRWSDDGAISGLWAVYAIGAQQIWSENATDTQGLYVFARAGFAPPDRARIDWSSDVGVNYVGLVPGRAADICGLGFSHKHYSRDLSDALERTGENGVESESILELTYQVKLAPCLTVQPDFQYVFQPGGHAGASNAAVLGLRVSTLF
ncbi:MAG: carbohydrate porin [Chthoniobacterales bacterium]